MKFICNIPLNVTKYINKVKKKKKTAFTTLICSQRNTTSDSCVCPAKCLKMTTANQDCTKNIFHNYNLPHLISTHSSHTEIEVTTI